MIHLPYVADTVIAGTAFENLEVVKMNKHSVWVRLPNGMLVKRHLQKHDIQLKFVRSV